MEAGHPITSFTFAEWVDHWMGALLWDPLALLTLVLAGSTIALWWTTRRLWLAGEASGADIKRSADAAAASAQALAMQMRAHVDIKTSGITPFDIEGERKIEIEIENMGQTTAYDVAHWNAAAFAPYPFDGELGRPPSNVIISRATLGRGAGSISNFAIPPLTEEEMSAVRAGTAAIYVWGEITYKDALGIDHITKYVRIQGGPHGFHGGSLAQCSFGNEAT